MTTFKRTAIAAVLCILLVLSAGCADTQPTEPPTVPTETAAPTEAPTVPATQAPTEAQEEYTARNPLTGEAVDALHTRRTFGVVFNNARPALPQHGISQADILYEFLAEGGVTRCIGLFSDITRAEAIGSIRSARQYFISLCQAYDAVFVHAGGSDQALHHIAVTGFEDIDGIKGYAGSWFYRDQDRRKAGYALEHTLFTTGESLFACAGERGYALERPDGVNYGLYFDEETVLSGEDAGSIRITYGIGNKQTHLDFDAESGRYLARQYDREWSDGNTGEQLAFDNVLVLYAATSYQEDNYLLNISLTGEGTGYFACGGKIVPVTWSRDGEDSMFFYHLEDGSALTLRPGRTYVSVVPHGSSVDFE